MARTTEKLLEQAAGVFKPGSFWPKQLNESTVTAVTGSSVPVKVSEIRQVMAKLLPSGVKLPPGRLKPKLHFLAMTDYDSVLWPTRVVLAFTVDYRGQSEYYGVAVVIDVSADTTTLAVSAHRVNTYEDDVVVFTTTDLEAINLFLDDVDFSQLTAA